MKNQSIYSLFVIALSGIGHYAVGSNTGSGQVLGKINASTSYPRPATPPPGPPPPNPF